MKQYVCVFDFETNGQKPSLCEPVQLAGLMLNPNTLDVVKESIFCSDMRPPDIEDEDFCKKYKDNIAWHANNYKVKPQEIFEKWKNAPEQSEVWTKWKTYLKKWNKNQSHRTMWTAPIRAGHNVTHFDIPIMDRLCVRYKDLQKNGEQKLFYPRDIIDIKVLAFNWFENLPEPEAYNMHDLRLYFGLSIENSHDALKDIEDEAWMISRFFRIQRQFAKKVKFKNAYNNQQ